MKVLFVCHRFPYPPVRGGKIRPFNIIKHLSGRHEVTVASLARSTEEAEAGQGIAPYCANYLMEVVTPPAAAMRMAARLATPTPLSMGYFHSPRLAARVREEARRTPFDLVFVHCSSAAQYVEDIAGPLQILDFGDMDSQKWLDYAKVRAFPLSFVYRLEGTKLHRDEKRLGRRFDLCTCTTRAELDTLRGYGLATPSDWFPNGVDLEFFKPAEAPYDPNAMVFVGRMDYYPNQQGITAFCDDVLPRIRARQPEATLTIVGADPSREIRRLGERPGVTVTGTVADVRPYVTGAALAVAPLNIARGTQNKILECMAQGVPVVASRQAASGIDAEPDEHLLVADGAEDFAAKVLRLLDEPAERARLAAAGRARVESHHTWSSSMQRLDRIIASLMKTKSTVHQGVLASS